MKKFLLVSFAVILSFGFTFSGDSNTDFKSDCPYLNKIHSSAGDLTCPYLEGKVSQSESSKKENLSCPYNGKMNSSSKECPYLKNKEKTNTGEIIQPKVIRLKTS